MHIDGAKLSDARVAANLSMEDVVAALGDGCNRSSVSRWEQGTLRPSDKRIQQLILLYKQGDFIVGEKA